MGETIILSVLPKAIAGLNKNSLRQKPGLRLIFPLFNVSSNFAGEGSITIAASHEKMFVGSLPPHHQSS